MSQWSEKIPETSQKSPSILAKINININDDVVYFQENSKRFVVEILTRNLALNLSGVLFFVGLGCSLKWWYKDQFFVTLLKQNLPALSEPQQKISWETGEYVLKEQNQKFVDISNYSSLVTNKIKNKSKYCPDLLEGKEKIQKLPILGTNLLHWEQLKRLDLYTNHVGIKFNPPWQKHAYQRFSGVFSTQIKKQKNNEVKDNNNWACEADQRAKYTIWKQPYSLYSHKIFPETWFKLSARGFYFLNEKPQLNEFNTNTTSKSAKKNHELLTCFGKFIINRVYETINLSTNTTILDSIILNTKRPKFQTILNKVKNSSNLETKLNILASRKGDTSVLIKQDLSTKSIKNNSSTPIGKLSYPLELTKTMSGWHFPVDALIFNSYLDEIPYKLENACLFSEASVSPLKSNAALVETVSKRITSVEQLYNLDNLGKKQYPTNRILFHPSNYINENNNKVFVKNVTKKENQDNKLGSETFLKKLQLFDIKQLLKNELQFLINTLPLDFVGEYLSNNKSPQNVSILNTSNVKNSANVDSKDLSTSVSRTTLADQVETERKQVTNAKKELPETKNILASYDEHESCDSLILLNTLNFTFNNLSSLNNPPILLPTTNDASFWMWKVFNPLFPAAPNYEPLANEDKQAPKVVAPFPSITTSTTAAPQASKMVHGLQSSGGTDGTVLAKESGNADVVGTSGSTTTKGFPKALFQFQQKNSNTIIFHTMFEIGNNLVWEIFQQPSYDQHILSALKKKISLERLNQLNNIHNESNNNKIIVKQDRIIFANIDDILDINPIDTKINFVNTKSRLMSGYVYPDVLSVSLKRNLYQWLSKNQTTLDQPTERPNITLDTALPQVREPHTTSAFHLLRKPFTTQHNIRTYVSKPSKMVRGLRSSGACEGEVQQAPNVVRGLLTSAKQMVYRGSVMLTGWYSKPYSHTIFTTQLRKPSKMVHGTGAMGYCGRGIDRLLDKACLTSLKIPITPSTFLLRFFPQQATPRPNLRYVSKPHTTSALYTPQLRKSLISFGAYETEIQQQQALPPHYANEGKQPIPHTTFGACEAEGVWEKPQRAFEGDVVCNADGTSVLENGVLTKQSVNEDFTTTAYPTGKQATSTTSTTFGGKGGKGGQNGSGEMVKNKGLFSKLKNIESVSNKALVHLSNFNTSSLFPYQKFNHHLAYFPGFSKPSQFFLTLPQISQGINNVTTITPKDLSTFGDKKGSITTSASLTESNAEQALAKVGYEEHIRNGSKPHNRLGYGTWGVENPFYDCNTRRIAYNGIAVQRNALTKDFQPFNESLKQSSIWGTHFLGPENPLTNYQCHFFGQRQLSPLNTNSFQRDYLRQLGKEILTQSNLKGFTERLPSVERAKILSFSKKVNSFFLKKRKYTYLLEEKDQWHLLFQEQLRTALEDNRKYPPLTLEEIKNKNSERIKISAPLIIVRFPKKLKYSDISSLDNRFFLGEKAKLQHDIFWRPFSYFEEKLHLHYIPRTTSAYPTGKQATNTTSTTSTTSTTFGGKGGKGGNDGIGGTDGTSGKGVNYSKPFEQELLVDQLYVPPLGVTVSQFCNFDMAKKWIIKKNNFISYYPFSVETYSLEFNNAPWLNKQNQYIPSSELHIFAANNPTNFVSPTSSSTSTTNTTITTEGGTTSPTNFASPTFGKEGRPCYTTEGGNAGVAYQKYQYRGSRRIWSYSNVANKLQWLIQEPLTSNSWAVLSQWFFLVSLLCWIEQMLLENVFPSLFALEQILLGGAGIKAGDRTRVIRVSKGTTPKFKDLAGIDGLLGELSELVLFLRGQRGIGERLLNKKSSYGVLLTGPPGTGKTFLVRALANEAGVPVLILSAGTLVANKLNSNKPSWSIRHAFRRAKQLTPCILFIDEIDALGKSRGNIVTDINEIVADTNNTTFGGLRSSTFSGADNLACKAESINVQFGKNWPTVPKHLITKWTYPLKSTFLQESNKISRYSLCEEKLFDLLNTGISHNMIEPNKAWNSKKNTHTSDENIQGFNQEPSHSSTHSFGNTNNTLNNPGTGGENSKRKFGPLTQLLVSMDGVNNLSGILIMGATNRPELLDPALTRPGRFERIIRIEKPSEQKRIEILQLYSHNLGVQHPIPWSYLANRTRGLTAADLAVAMNYSSLRAIIQGSTHTIETIEYGLDCITRFFTT